MKMYKSTMLGMKEMNHKVFVEVHKVLKVGYVEDEVDMAACLCKILYPWGNSDHEYRSPKRKELGDLGEYHQHVDLEEWLEQ